MKEKIVPSQRAREVLHRTLLIAWTALVAATCVAQPPRAADALLAIDQQRASVVERIVEQWGPPLAKSSASIGIDDLRNHLMALRADQLLAASLTGTLDGLRSVLGVDAMPTPASVELKSLPAGSEAVYTSVTPCRLVETRGTFAAVYQGDGTASHNPVPFAPNEIRSYKVQGGNGVCLTQLPAGLNPSAVQLQVFGIPTTSASGDIEVLPQGATFGSTATMVYVGSIAFNTVSTAARINLANDEISVQVRGGGANVAIDVVGYFAAPTADGEYFLQGGNAFGTTALLGTKDNQPVSIALNNAPVLRLAPVVDASGNSGINVVNGFAANAIDPGVIGATIAGGGFKLSGGTSFVNHIEQSFGTIGGGNDNLVTNADGTIAGGEQNTAGQFGTVGGGIQNTASGSNATVAGGRQNTASGNSSTVLGGFSNTASGVNAIAGGVLASADQDGCVLFVYWAEGLGANCLGTPHQFRMLGTHGLSIDYNTRLATSDGNGSRWAVIGDTVPGATIATWTGAFLSDGGAWTNASDRALKTGFLAADPGQVLAKVDAMPIMEWRYKSQPGELHLGPVAQDFYAAFGLGGDDKHITTVDEGGVALAAIQGLSRLLRDKDARIGAQQREISVLRDRIDKIEATLERMRTGR
ncbi:MAG TPA: tail fiber domain-containing protein [Casimicrobiaceae bacterium]|nr:tail fiber domain-containing protein [Casimicrobiaceae bacterium]